jgi:GTPase
MNEQNQTLDMENREYAILIDVRTPERSHNWERSFTELHNLAETAGVQVVGVLVQARQAVDPTYFLGKGKCEELLHLAEERGANVVIANQELTPSQIKHLERLLDRKVIDRTQLILHIFAERARTREGKLQVELAQLKYLLPRLIGHGVDLSRLGGGIGSKGPGETKLELDRRKIRKQIHRLEMELQNVAKHRERTAKRRAKNDLASIALVGYTNAGKTTLFRRLVETYGNADARQGHDRLFDTLETTTRRISIPHASDVLISDTVGFIQDLPHHLVQSFRSTLEGVVEADLLLHIVDASDDQWPQQLHTVYQVLDELQANHKQIVTVFNKIDQLEDPSSCFVDPVADATHHISARTGEGIERLLLDLATRIKGHVREYTLQVPYHDGSGHAEVHAMCEILAETHMDTCIRYQVLASEGIAAKLQMYVVT